MPREKPRPAHRHRRCWHRCLDSGSGGCSSSDSTFDEPVAIIGNTSIRVSLGNADLKPASGRQSSLMRAIRQTGLRLGRAVLAFSSSGGAAHLGRARMGRSTDLELSCLNISRRLEEILRVTRDPPGGSTEDQGLRLAGTRMIVLRPWGQRRAAPQREEKKS